MIFGLRIHHVATTDDVELSVGERNLVERNVVERRATHDIFLVGLVVPLLAKHIAASNRAIAHIIQFGQPLEQTVGVKRVGTRL